MKDNLGQECVEGGGVLSLQGKVGTIALDFPRKMTVFPVLTLLFRQSLPKLWLFHPHKHFSLETFDNVILKIVTLVAI